MTTALATASAPVFPLSMFDPVHLGIDENGEHVDVDLGSLTAFTCLACWSGRGARCGRSSH